MINKRMAQRRKLSIQNCFYHLDFFELVKYARLGNIEIWSTILKWLWEVIWYIPKKKKNRSRKRSLIRIIYGWTLASLPFNCECGIKFDIQHALSCKKRDFVSLRHIHIRTITSILLKEVFKDVRVEPQLHQLTGEYLQHSTVAGNELRLDISARGFW